MKIFTTGEVARILGIPKEKIYYAEERGIFPRSQKTGTGKRFYAEADITRLRGILRQRAAS